jgi:threonine dehydrogenase-like Zn-dependent dehydrogenase
MSLAYTPADFDRSLKLLTDGEIDLRPWTTELQLEQGQQAFDRMTKEPGNPLKTVLCAN